MLSQPESLGRVALFRTLDEQALRTLNEACGFKRAAAGSWIIDHGASGNEVFFVLRGHVRVVVSSAGVETILRDIRQGDYFGELAALDGQPRSAGIFAVTDAALAVMPAAVFRSAIHDHPDVCDQVLGVLVGQIRMLANRANETAALRMKPRLWAELQRLGRPSAGQTGVLVVSPPPTHAELAARIGSQREAVTKELGALERMGLIARRRGAIEILAPTRLAAMTARAAED
jgi:CRP-like cAMP-binding protein